MAKSNKELWLEKYPFGYYNTENDKGTGAEVIDSSRPTFDDYDDDSSDFDIDWDEYERSLDIDSDMSDEEADYYHSNLYGGDRTYCPDCGNKLTYGEDGYSYCPDCNSRAENDWSRKVEDYEEDRDEDLAALDEAYLKESREVTTLVFDMIEDGMVSAEDVARMCLSHLSEEDAEDIANTLLDGEVDTYGDVRQYTNALIDLCEEGSLGWDTLVNECLQYMSEDDVSDMAHSNELIDDDEEERESVDTAELADNFKDFLIENGYREDCVTVNNKWDGWDIVTCKDDGYGEITVEFVEDDGDFEIYISDSFLFATDYDDLVEVFKEDVIPYIEYEDGEGDLEEGWARFEYASGANPYIAKTEEEKKRLCNKWGKDCEFKGNINGNDYYVINDKPVETPFVDDIDESIKSPDAVNNALKKFRSEGDDYGCDKCGKRVPQVKAHWFNGASVGLCDDCYDKLSKDEEERLDTTGNLSESILTNDGYVTPSEGAVEQFLNKYGFSDDRYQKDVYTDNASKGKEIIASFVDGINSADYRRISERAKEFFGQCPVEVRLGKEHKDGEDLWATLVFDFGKCRIDEAKQLNEGPGAGYTLEGELRVTGIETLKPIKYDADIYYGPNNSYDVTFECVGVGTIENFRFNSYYYGDEIDSANIDISTVKVNLWKEGGFEDIEAYVKSNLEDIRDCIVGARVESSYNYGGGYVHSKFDGTVCDTDKPLDNSYSAEYNDVCAELFAMDATIRDTDIIEYVDKAVTGGNYYDRYEVMVDGDCIEDFDNESEAIEYAKKDPDADEVVKTFYHKLFNGDLDIEESETIWEREDEDFDESLNETLEGKYCIVARTNDGKFKFYKDGAFVDNYKEATIFTDMDEARAEWFDIDKSKYKRVFIPNYDESSFASLNEEWEEANYYDVRQLPVGTRVKITDTGWDGEEFTIEAFVLGGDRDSDSVRITRDESSRFDADSRYYEEVDVDCITDVFYEESVFNRELNENTDPHFIDKRKRSAIYGEDDYGYDEYDVRDVNPLPHIKLKRGNRHITLNDTSKVGEEGHPIQRGLDGRLTESKQLKESAIDPALIDVDKVSVEYDSEYGDDTFRRGYAWVYDQKEHVIATIKAIYYTDICQPGGYRITVTTDNAELNRLLSVDNGARLDVVDRSTDELDMCSDVYEDFKDRLREWQKNHSTTTNEKLSESKQLNEGPGAGYTLSGKLKITKVESLTPVKFEDADYGSYDVTFNCVALGTIEDFEFYSYMYGDKMDSAEVEISAIKTNFYAEHIDDIEALVRNNLEEVKDCLVGATVHLEYVYGAGWLHSKFDGTIAEINDLVKDSDIVYGDTFDIEVFEFDAKIKDTDVIEYVDKAVSGDNFSYMYTVIDEDGNPGDAFFEKDDAIEYAKKNNCQAVDKTECKELFGGDTEWLDSEIIWERDSEEDFE